MLGRRAAVGATVAALAVGGAGAAFAATHGSSVKGPAKAPAKIPARTMPHGHCHLMDGSAPASATDT